MAGSRFNAALWAAASAAALVAAQPGQAASFSQYFSFGDSYADTGNLVAIVRASGNTTLLNELLGFYPTGRFSGGTNFVDDLSKTYGVTPVNYAIGGAQAGTGNEFGFNGGFETEIAEFEASGQKISSGALVTVNIGGNDARDYYENGGTMSGVAAAAATSAANATGGVEALVAAGAKTIVFTVGNVTAMPEAAGYSAAQVSVGNAYSLTYNAEMEQSLAALHAQGVNVVWVDMAKILTTIETNLSAFGFNSVACSMACVGNTTLQNQNLFYADNIHLTSAGFQALANYIANELNAPQTLPSAGQVGLSSAEDFAGSLFARLDLINPPSSGAAALNYAEPLPTHKALSGVKPPEPSPWSVFMQGFGGAGSQTTTTTTAGGTWTSLGGEFGLEYRLSPEWVFGAAGEYAQPRLKLSGGQGSTTVDAWQGAVYGGYAGRNLFVEGLLSVGRLGYANQRPGVIDTITSKPDGSSFVAALKGGYLFDINDTTRLGPIAGLTFAHVGIGSYSESGDPALTLHVGSQSVEATIGSLGAQLRKAFAVPAGRFDAFVNLTVEDNFSGSGRSISYSQTSAPLIVDTLNAAGSGRGAFGRIAGGVSANLSDRISVSATLSQTAWQPGGQDFAATAAIKLSF